MYVPLFVESSYSLLKSVINISSLCKKCVNMGLKAVAITDNHNLFGAMEFSLEAKKAGIKPIIGCRVRIEGNRELLLYCKDSTGYENLSYLLTTSYTNSKLHEIRWEQLMKKSEGLIAIAVPSILCSKNTQDIKFCAEYLNSGIEWYVGLEKSKEFYQETAYMSQLFKTPVVAISETCFLEPNEEGAHDVLLCIKNKRYISQEDRPKSSPELCLKSYDEMLTSFPKFAIDNTIKIADKCNFILKETTPRLPKFKTNIPEIEELRNMASAGLEKILLSNKIEEKDTYRERLKYELSVIEDMGFPGYFLIVSDFIRFAKESDIPVGPGRGSCVASVVSWSIGITEVDPIKFDLVFERFLNPKRISIPDMDIDFSPVGRQKIIEYVKSKYGKQSVSGIITFGSLSSRAVLKDVGRVLQVPFSKTDNLSKQIQVLYGKPFTLEETYERDKAFAAEIDGDESLKNVFKIAKQLEGLHRHASAHAAGIIITDVPIYRIAPLYNEENFELPLVQFSMKYAELAGLVKFDFLGLTALDIIQQTIKILDSRGESVSTLNIPLDDEKTFEMLRNGHTQGVFQFETPGMTKLIRDIQASCIEDLVATVALYRPGPMENIDLFIRSTRGEEKIDPIYPGLEKILSSTYGIMIYQEQILRIAQDIAGYTLAEADLLRRAIGKKIQKEMEIQREIFVKKTHEVQGGDIAKAEKLFKQIETFANYGFNKAHAVAYAIIGYWGAYLKAHYLLEFMCASMDQEQMNTEKLTELVLDAANLNIQIQKPHINESIEKFKIVDNTILYSFSAIKNVGEQKATTIVEERDKNGPFTSIENFVNRVKLNKRELESLVKSGAMDAFDTNRLYMLNLGLKIMETPPQQQFIFPYSMLVNSSESWTKEESSQFQKEIIGAYLDENPLKYYPIKHFYWKWISELDQSKDAKDIKTICIIESYIKKIDRNKKPYLICEVFDISHKWRCMVTDESSIDTVFSSKGKIICCTINIKNGRITLQRCIPVDKEMAKFTEIHIETKEDKNTNNTNKNIDQQIIDKSNLKPVLDDLMTEIEKYRVKNGNVSVYLHSQGAITRLATIGKFLDFCNQIPQIVKCRWYAK